jgi:hypothetical protein
MRINRIELGKVYRMTDEPDAGPVKAITIIGRLHPKNSFGTECVSCEIMRGDEVETIFVNPANMEPWPCDQKT